MNKNTKIFATIFIILIAAMVVFINYDSNLEQGTILAASELVEDSSGTTYIVVPFTQEQFETESLRTYSLSEDVAGTDSDGNQLEGEITAEFALEVEEMGWKMPITQRYSDEYVSRIFDSDTVNQAYDLDEISIEYEMSGSGIPYYEFVDNSWTPNIEYKTSVTVDGKTYSVDVDQTSTRYDVGDTGIYYMEAGSMFARGTATQPSFDDIQIIEYGSNNQLIFLDKDEGTINSILDDSTEETFYNRLGWNNILTSERSSALTTNGMYGLLFEGTTSGYSQIEIDNCDFSFGVEDVVHGYNNDDWYVFVNPSYDKIKTLDDIEVSPTPDYSEYQISSNEFLEYKTDVVILGAWYIPISYGEVHYVQKDPTPEIVSVETLGTLYDTGSCTVEVTVQCVENSGVIKVVPVKLDETKSIDIEPANGYSYDFDENEEHTFTFTIKATDITVKELEGVLQFQAIGSGDGNNPAIYNWEYTIYDTDHLSADDYVEISVKAVDSDGNYLSDFPVYVSVDDAPQYGTWEGDVIKDSTFAITGVTTKGLVPQNTEETATEDGQEFELVYGDGENETTDYTWLIIMIVVFLVMMITGLGAYYYSENNKPKSKSKKAKK